MGIIVCTAYLFTLAVVWGSDNLKRILAIIFSCFLFIAQIASIANNVWLQDRPESWAVTPDIEINADPYSYVRQEEVAEAYKRSHLIKFIVFEFENGWQKSKTYYSRAIDFWNEETDQMIIDPYSPATKNMLKEWNVSVDKDKRDLPLYGIELFNARQNNYSDFIFCISAIALIILLLMKRQIGLEVNIAILSLSGIYGIGMIHKLVIAVITGYVIYNLVKHKKIIYSYNCDVTSVLFLAVLTCWEFFVMGTAINASFGLLILLINIVITYIYMKLWKMRWNSKILKAVIQKEKKMIEIISTALTKLTPETY